MPKVMIGVPMHAGTLSAATMMSVCRGSAGSINANFHCLGLSLLAKNFNLLFCLAVYKGFDYFILHHSDLGVTGCINNTFQGKTWVEILISRLEQFNLKALSAVVPIKSPQGFMSSGLETVAGDAFSLRRITMKELNNLPSSIITRDDVCKEFGVKSSVAGALLINSGLLIMDIRGGGGVFREKKWDGFNIIDRIAWNTKGRPESFTIPEDWNFSRWCHENNVSYACTRELTISHIGGSSFENHGVWGTEEHDLVRQQMSIEDYIKS